MLAKWPLSEAKYFQRFFCFFLFSLIFENINLFLVVFNLYNSLLSRTFVNCVCVSAGARPGHALFA